MRKSKSIVFLSASCLLASAISTAGFAASFSSDLETESDSCWASPPAGGCNGWKGIKGLTLSAEKTHSGKQAMKASFRRDEQENLTYRTVDDSKHIFVRFYDYYATGFDFAAGMKIGRISSFNQATQRNNFDIIVQARATASANRCGTTDSTGLAISYNGGPVDWGIAEGNFVFQRGRWYEIQVEIKLNTPSRTDGEVRLWVDGKVIAEKTGINIVGAGTAGINSVLYGGWYSNSDSGRNPCPDPAQESVRYIDDVAYSDSPIAPVGNVPVLPVQLRNGSFELDDDGDAKPDNWSPSPYVSRSNVVASAGSYSMRHQSSTNASYTVEQTVPNITGSRAYRFDSRTYIPKTQRSFRYDLILEWRNGAQQVLRQDYVDTFTQASGNGEWRSAGLTRTAPADAVSAVIRIKMSGLNGTVYSDDFKFAEVTVP